jgi:ADP-ribose pyrophosphatase
VTTTPVPDRILAETKYLRLVDRGGWYFVERPFATGVVVLVAVTPDRKLVLVEQHRPALGGNVIELPAGLAGDEPGHEAEEMESAARRELLEETGYRAQTIERIVAAATGPGISSEMITFFRATGLEKVGAGGGVAAENITVIEVPLEGAEAWLLERARAGAIIAVKVWAGLWFARGQ